MSYLTTLCLSLSLTLTACMDESGPTNEPMCQEVDVDKCGAQPSQPDLIVTFNTDENGVIHADMTEDYWEALLEYHRQVLIWSACTSQLLADSQLGM